MEKIFHLKENGTTVRTELSAGITTFFAMAYIIFVNPVFLSAAGMSAEGAMIATCIGAAIGSILCAVISNQPYAMAPGMGLNTSLLLHCVQQPFTATHGSRLLR